MDEIKAIELYEFFDGEGYDLGNQDGFLQALQDENKRVELFYFFEKEGYDIGEVDDFILKKKDGSDSTFPEGNMEPSIQELQGEDGSLESSDQINIDQPGSEEDPESPSSEEPPAESSSEAPPAGIEGEQEQSQFSSADPFSDQTEPPEPENWGGLKSLLTQKTSAERRAPGYTGLFDLNEEVENATENATTSGSENVETPDFFDQSLSVIDRELIESTEEFVLPLMRYHFGDYGFAFEDADDMGDGMMVKAQNGEELYVNLDRMWNKGKSAAELKNFLQSNRTESTKLKMQEEGYKAKERKVLNERAVQTELKTFQDDTEIFAAELKTYLSSKAQFDALDPVTTPNYKDMSILLEKERVRLIEMEAKFKNRGKYLDRIIGSYVEMKADQKSATGLFWNALLDGSARIASKNVDRLISGTISVLPLDVQMGTRGYRRRVAELANENGITNYSEDYINQIVSDDDAFDQLRRLLEQKAIMNDIESKIVDENKKLILEDKKPGEEILSNPFSWYANDPQYDDRLGMREAVRGGLRYGLGMDETTVEGTKKSKENFWGGALIGMTESIPAMLGPSPLRVFNMISLAQDHVEEEMENDRSFDNISENEKAMISVPLGIVTGILEEIGFRGILKGNPWIANTILKRVLGKTTANAGSKTFLELVKKEVNSVVAQGLIRVGAAGAAEFETGFLQEGADIATKEIYNSLKEKEMFTTPEDIEAALAQMFKSGLQEAVGGLVLGTPHAVVFAGSKGDFTKLDDGVFQMFNEIKNDPTIKTGYVESLKQRMLDGKITKKQGKNAIAMYDQVVGIMDRIPNDLNVTQKKELLGNLLRQQELNDYINKYDQQLTKKQQNELTELKNEVQGILLRSELAKKAAAKTDVETSTETDAEGNTTTTRVEVSEEFTKEKLKEDGIENPTQEQIDKKQAELMEEGRQTINQQKQKDAIQESSTEKVDAQVSTESSSEVGEVQQSETTTESDTETETDITEEQETEVDPQEAADLQSMMEGTESETIVVDETNPNVTVEQDTEVEIDPQYENEQAKNEQETTIKDLALKAANAVKTILPDVTFKLHSTEKSFIDAVGQNGRGFYNTDTKVVHINMPRANKRTVAHEVFHAAVLSNRGAKEVVDITNRMVSTLQKSITDPAVKKELNDFIKKYKGQDLQNEEYTAELFGMLADNYTKLTKPSQNVVKRFLTRVAQLVGVETGFTKADQDIVDLLNTLSGKIREGQEVTQEEVSKLVVDKTKPKTKKISLKERVRNKVDEIADAKEAGYANKWFNPIVMTRAGIKSPEEIKEYIIQSFENEGKIDERFKKDIFTMLYNDAFGIKVDGPGQPGTTKTLDKAVNKAINESKTYQEALQKLRQNEEVGQELADVELITQEDSEFEAAMNEQMELESEIASLPMGMDLFLFEELDKVHVKDYDLFGDPNYRKDFGIGLNRLLRKDGKRDIDTTAQELSEIYGSEITVQDIIDHLTDRASSPGKYTKANVRRANEIQGNNPGRLQRIEGDQRNIYQLAVQNGINQSGFFPANLFNPGALRRRLSQYGYGLKAAYRSYGDRGLTGYYITKPNGRKWNLPAQNGRMQVIFNKENDAIDIINQARAEGFQDSTIKDYLTRVRDFGKREINALMKVSQEALGNIPTVLGDVEGGMMKGIQLFDRVVKKYNRLKEDNKSKTKKKSPEQILDETIEYLESQPEYKALSDKGQLSTKQMLLSQQVATALGGKRSIDLGNSIKEARLSLAMVARNNKNLKEVQRHLRSFVRKVMPMDVYSKSDVTRMLKLVNEATLDNINNVKNQILEEAAEKNNKRLDASIQNILNDPYAKVVSSRLRGKKVDQQTRDRFAYIKELVTPKGKKFKTEDEVVDYKAKLNTAYNELAKKPNPTNSDYEQMVNLSIALNLIDAEYLMGPKDLSKTSALASVEADLKDIVLTGRANFKEELRQQHLEYRSQFEEVYRDVVGRVETFRDEAIRRLNEKGIKEPNENDIYEEVSDIIQEAKETENFVEPETENEKELTRIEKVKERLTNLVKGYNSFARTIVDRNSDMFLLMDRISKLPGELFGGTTQELVTNRIDEATREFKQRKMLVEGIIVEKMKELYGKNYKQAQESNAVKVRVKDQLLSPNEMYYLYNQYKDPLNHPGFVTKFGDRKKMKNILKENGIANPTEQQITDQAQTYTSDLMSEIENTLDPKLKEFADWQVETLFPLLYQHYNSAYKDIYRINMPYNNNYAGMIYREGTDDYQQDIGIDLLSGTPQYHNVVAANSTKMREDNSRAIKPTDGTDALFTYVRDMEYFSAYARPMTDINKLFTNPVISKAITNLYGENTLNAIRTQITKISNKGINEGNSKQDYFVDTMQDIFVTSRLGLSPVILLKQLTSAVTYGNDIGYDNWMKNAALARFGKGQSVKDVWKEISENSVYLQDRDFRSITRSIEMYSDSKLAKMVPESKILKGTQKESLLNILMYNVRVGDRGAIFLGGVPNYVYYKNEFKKKNPKATEQQAIDHAIRLFERDTKRTQQSTDLQDRDYYQTKDPYWRSLNMFLTTPKQYLRKELYGMRNMMRYMKGEPMKGTGWQAFRTFMVYHTVMPMFFQFVANGMPGVLADWDEEDPKDLMRAALLGNFNGFFILGELATMAADAATGKPWAGVSTKNLPIFTQAGEIIRKYTKASKLVNPELKEQAYMRMWMEIAQITGIPANNIYKMSKNFEELLEGGEDPEKVIMRLFNYSDYQINGKKIRKGSSKNKKTNSNLPMYKDRDSMYRDASEPKKRKSSKKSKKSKKSNSQYRDDDSMYR